MRRPQRILAAAGSTLLLTLGAGLATALPASALPNPPDGCPSGDACVWKDIHYSTAGTINDSYKFGLYQSHFGSVKYPGTGYYVGDSASSAYNHGKFNESAYFYSDAGCSGPSFYLKAGQGDSDFTNGSPSIAGDPFYSFNDQLSSGAFASQRGKC